jgi:4-hydroxybenzoate polyprenyltransferase
MRISNAPTVVTNVIAGAALGGMAILELNLWLLALAMILFYSAGMILNDVCDLAIDRTERPDRPLPSGRMSRLTAISWTMLFSAGGFALIGWRFLPHQRLVMISSLILCILIVFYDFWHKHNPLSSLVMSGCRLMVYVSAYVSVSGSWLNPLYLPGLAVVMYVSGITLLARREAQNKARRWPLIFIFFPLLLPVLLYFAPANYVVQPPSFAAVLPGTLAFVSWTIYALQPAFRAENPQLGLSIGRLVAGICMVDLLIIASQASPDFYLDMEEWSGLAVCVMMLVLTSILQRNVKGH